MLSVTVTLDTVPFTVVAVMVPKKPAAPDIAVDPDIIAIDKGDETESAACRLILNRHHNRSKPIYYLKLLIHMSLHKQSLGLVHHQRYLQTC